MKIEESKTMQEIHEIQEELYEEMKDLTPKEKIRRLNDSAYEYVKKHKLNVRFENKH